MHKYLLLKPYHIILGCLHYPRMYFHQKCILKGRKGVLDYDESALVRQMNQSSRPLKIEYPFNLSVK